MGSSHDCWEDALERTKQVASEVRKEQWEKDLEKNDWPEETRIDIIGTNGGDGQHYTNSHHIIDSPKHYDAFGKECIKLIASSCTVEEFRGYCYGCWLKYRFRLGNKASVVEDYRKSEKYKELFDKHKHLCTDTPF